MKGITDRSSVLPFVKQAVKQVLKPYRILTGSVRLLPDFIIIGAQRCGTTSLHNYLIQHPCVASAFQKEVHFFDINFRKGIAWYQAHFPCFLYRYYLKQICKQDVITGEASPYYIFHPHAAKRVLKVVPRVKLIALLRNPIDRAYSHYHHAVRNRREILPFEDAIQREEDRLAREIEKMLGDENYYSFNHQHYSYLSKGIYVDQLKIWMKYFSRKQIMILRSEDLYTDPSTVLKRVLEFLNLPSWKPKKHKRYNYASYPKMNTTTRKRLIDYFKPHNQRLYEYLGVSFGWDR